MNRIEKKKKERERERERKKASGYICRIDTEARYAFLELGSRI